MTISLTLLQSVISRMVREKLSTSYKIEVNSTFEKILLCPINAVRDPLIVVHIENKRNNSAKLRMVVVPSNESGHKINTTEYNHIDIDLMLHDIENMFNNNMASCR